MSAEHQNPEKLLPFIRPFAVSAIIIVLWLAPLMIKQVIVTGTGAGIPGIFGLAAFLVTSVEILALLATITAPLLYGWYTRDRAGAAFVGIVPFLLLMIIARIRSGISFDDYLVRSVLYCASLSAIGGLEGVFASRHEGKPMALAIAFAVLWIIVFLSGIT